MDKRKEFLCTQVMASIDGLVTEQLPGKAPCLANVRERSDAMMAIYPGRGSRFAKHIGGCLCLCVCVCVCLWGCEGVCVRLCLCVCVRVEVLAREKKRNRTPQTQSSKQCV